MSKLRDKIRLIMANNSDKEIVFNAVMGEVNKELNDIGKRFDVCKRGILEHKDRIKELKDKLNVVRGCVYGKEINCSVNDYNHELQEENNLRKDEFMMEHRLTIALQNEKKILQAELKALKSGKQQTTVDNGEEELERVCFNNRYNYEIQTDWVVNETTKYRYCINIYKNDHLISGAKIFYCSKAQAIQSALKSLAGGEKGT